MSKLRYRLGGNLLYALSQITRRTGRYHIAGFSQVEQAKQAGHPLILAAWHGMTMMLAGFFLAHYNLHNFVLILPDDWRGETLTHWAKRIGITPFPMNLHGDSTLSAARKLAELVKLVKNGHDCYITPDGPDGPAYQIKPGAAYIAQKSQATLLPIGAYTRTGYRLNRWDQYVVPRPFSRMTIVIGRPIPAPPKADLATITEPLTDALHRVTAQAAANYYALKDG